MALRASSVRIPAVYIKKGLWATINQTLWNIPTLHRHGSSMPNKKSAAADSVQTTCNISTALIGGTSIYKGAQEDEWIISLAKFAVNHQNQNQSANLQFVRVVGASHTAASSLLYHITLEATESKKQMIFHTIVWLQIWKNFMELLMWKPVNKALSAVGIKRGDLKLHEAVMVYMNQMKRRHPRSEYEKFAVK